MLERIKLQIILKRFLPPEIIHIIEYYYYKLNFNLVIKKITEINIYKKGLYYINLDFLNIRIMEYKCDNCCIDCDKVFKCKLCFDDYCNKCSKTDLFDGICESCLLLCYDTYINKKLEENII